MRIFADGFSAHYDFEFIQIVPKKLCKEDCNCFIVLL